ncbi:MAG: S-layer homology domain-containing protein [Candidatus Sericytochromatia bacterium]|nr:S-layer homology domain-containing protein [Candidatus Sericytochromatia bacterium]
MFQARALTVALTAGFILFGVSISSPAVARSSVADMEDLRVDHWAFGAIQAIVEKYAIMEGFPDKTFKGQRNLTRYEFAAALMRVMQRVEEMMQHGRDVGTSDLRVLRDLRDEFKAETNSLKLADAAMAERIKKLEEELAALKDSVPTVRFGGSFDAGMQDMFEDNKRPGYYSNFGLDMSVKINPALTVKGNFGGSYVNRRIDEAGSLKTEDKSGMDNGYLWAEYKPGGFLDPKVAFGYRSPYGIRSSTTLPHLFGESIMGSRFGESSAIGLASPNLNRGGTRQRGIRLNDTFSIGASVSPGPATITIAAEPDLFLAQAMLDFGLVKVKAILDADQTLFFGEIVQDPLYNESLVVDIGNETFGGSLQGSFRRDEFRAASAFVGGGFSGWKMGVATKYENETAKDQQVIVGGYLKTPEKWGDLKIPSLILGIQEPLTLQNGQLLEGSKPSLGDRAGFMAQLVYDNPVIPNLTIEYSQKSLILFGSGEDIVSNTIAIRSSVDF